jgi:signal transduction histidine kinase
MATIAGRRHLVLPGLVAVTGTLELSLSGVRPRWLTVGCYWAACAVLALARWAPLAVPPAVATLYAGAGAAGADIVSPASWIVVLAVACFDAGLRRGLSRVLRSLASVTAAVAVSFAGLAWFTTFAPSLAFGLVFAFGSWSLGVALRAALDRAGRAGVAAEREGMALLTTGERAAAQTRARLAAEIPDVLAHAVGAMLVQTAVAADQVGSSPRLASQALDDVARAGRNALAQTAGVLQVLRRPQPAAAELPAPAVLPAPSGTSATAGRPRRSDAVVPAVIGLLVTLEAAAGRDASLALTLVAAWLSAGVLCLRRAYPSWMAPAVTGVMLAASWLGVSGDDDPATTVLLFALAGLSTGRHVPRERLWLGLAAVLAGCGLLLLSVGVGGGGVLVTAVVLVPWCVGVLVRGALDRARDAAAAAERARLTRGLAADRSAADERARVARGVHDLLADSLHVMVVQATVAAELVARDPDDAVVAVERVQDAGREALHRLGRLLPLIQDGHAGAVPEPGTAALPGLAERFTCAGLGVELDMADGVPLPPMVEVSAYHIVAEALTNALKHAPGSSVQVRLTRTGSWVDVEIRNSRASARPSDRPAPGGHGLIGLRERVAAFGGRLDAGPTADGGFRLAASMPLPLAAGGGAS